MGNFSNICCKFQSINYDGFKLMVLNILTISEFNENIALLSDLHMSTKY